MYKLMMLVMVVAFAGLFFVNGPNDEPILSFDDIKPNVPDMPAIDVPSAQTTTTKVYKWQDEKGVWQFSNHPQDMVGAELVEINDSINTMAALEIPANKPASQTSGQRLQTGMSNLPAGMTSVSPEKLNEMMETVNSLQGVVDQRQEALDEITGNN